jgi:uncharacterized protein (DUF885 family)
MHKSIAASALLLAACAAAPPRRAAAPDPAARVTALADEYVRAYVASAPEAAQASGLPNAPDDGLSDNSLAALAAWQHKVDELGAALDQIDATALLSRPEWITYGYLREAVAGDKAQRVCHFELWPVNQMSGWPSLFAQLASIQRAGTPELRRAALSRWQRLPHYLEVEMENAREGLRRGYSTPRRIIREVVSQLDQLLALAPEKTPFFDPARRDGDAEFQRQWKGFIAEELFPVVRRYRAFLADEYLARAREALAVTANPDGLACWKGAFRAQTTLERDPDETYRLGEARVASMTSEAQALAKKNIGTDDLAAIVRWLGEDRTDRFKSRDEVLAFAKSAVARAHDVMPKMFNGLPQADVLVQPIPEMLEAEASTGYEPGTADGSRPGTYRINLGRLDEQRRSDVEVTAFHETYPGHHLQIAIAQRLPKAHSIVTLVGNGSFIEGWARYAEALSEDLGLYTTLNGRIHRRMWPGHGMVVDVGLHIKGWSREEAVRYVESSGMPAKRAEAMVDRIVVWPAQLTAYDTGALEILALRKKAEAALGPRFDLRRFHDVLLGSGSVTLPMLHQLIDRWLAQQQQLPEHVGAASRSGG